MKYKRSAAGKATKVHRTIQLVTKESGWYFDRKPKIRDMVQITLSKMLIILSTRFILSLVYIGPIETACIEYLLIYKKTSLKQGFTQFKSILKKSIQRAGFDK